METYCGTDSKGTSCADSDPFAEFGPRGQRCPAGPLVVVACVVLELSSGCQSLMLVATVRVRFGATCVDWRVTLFPCLTVVEWRVAVFPGLVVVTELVVALSVALASSLAGLACVVDATSASATRNATIEIERLHVIFDTTLFLAGSISAGIVARAITSSCSV